MKDCLEAIEDAFREVGQITLHINNVGLGMQFAAVGAEVYKRATAQGLGRDIPLEWFLQAVPG